MNNKRFFSASLLFLFVCMAGAAQIQAAEPEVAVLFQTRSAGVGEEIPLMIRITGAQGNIQAPHIAVPQGVESYYTGRSSNISFINGVSSSSVEFSYVLVGRRGGKYNIQSIDVNVAGKIYHSEPLAFEITGDTNSVSSAGQAGAPVRPPRAAPSAPNAPAAAPQSPVQEPPAAYRPEDSNIYVVASADKTTAYPNEQILLSYSLYTRYDTRYEGFGDEPEMSGFWIEEFPPERDVRRETVRVGGKQYIRAEIRQIALFPTAPAQYEIKPGTLKVSIRQEPQSSGVFDEFFNDSFFNGSGFFSRRENRILKPAPIQIKVIPFPEEGKPANFNGAVGNFRMTASIDHEAVKQNEPVTLTVKIEGEGNIETLKQPGIPELDGFKVYESDSKAALSKSGYVIGGRKTFEIVFIPTEAGSHFIPKLSFSFFNPRTRQYQTLFTEAFTLKIEASKEAPPALPQGMENEEVLKKGIKKEGQDIQYIQEKLEGEGAAGLADKTLGGLTLLDFLLTLLFAAGLWRARHESILAKDTGLRRRKLARQTALSRMKALKKHSRSDKPQDVVLFFIELDKVLTQYLSDKFNLSAFGVTRISLERELEKSLGRDHELFREITKLYGLCEESRYGMGEVSSAMRAEALEILKQTISVFEKVKKNNPFMLAAWMAFLILGTGAPLALAVSPQDRALFERANKLYYSEKYEDAGKIYSQLAGLYPKTAAFEFNLGNVNYRLGKTGPAILAYEKAHSLAPRNRDIVKNREQVNAGLEYRIEDKRNWYLIAGEKVLEQFTEDEISLLAAGVYFLFVINLCLPLWRLGFLQFGRTQKVLLTLMIVSMIVFAAKRIEVRMIRDAIVMVKKAEARYGPSDGDRMAFRLGEGLKVFVVDHRDGWSRIILTSGEDGWIKNSQIAEVV